MATYNQGLFTQAQQATGIVNPVLKFLTEQERAALRPGDPHPRAYDDQGRALVEVECVRQLVEFGKVRTDVFGVRLHESPETASIQPGPITFANLSVDVFAKGGRLVERWMADGVAPTTGRRSGGATS